MKTFEGDENDLSEFTYIRKFEQMTDMIFEDSGILIKEWVQIRNTIVTCN